MKRIVVALLLVMIAATTAFAEDEVTYISEKTQVNGSPARWYRVAWGIESYKEFGTHSRMFVKADCSANMIAVIQRTDYNGSIVNREYYGASREFFYATPYTLGHLILNNLCDREK